MITKIQITDGQYFTIEEDRSCFILREYGKNKEGIEIIKDEVYPRTFIRSLEIISHRLRKNSDNKIKIENYSKTIKNTQEKLMEELEIVSLDLENKIKELNEKIEKFNLLNK